MRVHVHPSPTHAAAVRGAFEEDHPVRFGIVRQPLAALRVRRLRRFSLLPRVRVEPVRPGLRVPFQEAGGQQGNVLQTLAQSGEPHGEDLQAEVQIPAEAPALDQGLGQGPQWTVRALVYGANTWILPFCTSAT